MKTNVKRRFQRKLIGGLTYAVMAMCGSLTLYIFAASFETVFNRDLPIAEAVGTIDLSAASRVIAPYRSVAQHDFGNYGRPLFLKLPAQNVKMVLGPTIEVNGHFLARANTAHMALTSAPHNGNIGDITLYYHKGWRTNDKPELSKVGDNIFIDTDRDWRYFYRIIAFKEVAAAGDSYIAQETSGSRLFLIGADSKSNRLYITQASLVNVQNVRL